MSHDMRFPTMWYVRQAKAQTSLRIPTVWSEPLLVAWIFLSVKLLTEHRYEFLSLNGGCTCLSESTLVKMPHCWKSHVVAQMCLAQGPQRSDAGESWTRGPSVSSQALYHWATALPTYMVKYVLNLRNDEISTFVINARGPYEFNDLFI